MDTVTASGTVYSTGTAGVCCDIYPSSMYVEMQTGQPIYILN